MSRAVEYWFRPDHHERQSFFTRLYALLFSASVFCDDWTEPRTRLGAEPSGQILKTTCTPATTMIWRKTDMVGFRIQGKDILGEWKRKWKVLSYIYWDNGKMETTSQNRDAPAEQPAFLGSHT